MKTLAINAALPERMDQQRIEFLDGFRGIAILFVIAFHYYSLYANDARGMYPFGARWSEFPVFEYGFYGVHLFFSVSGFVISLTLMRCATLSEFAVRRFGRLWPTMLLCASISFSFLSVFPHYWPQNVSNFLPSLTLIEPGQYQRVFKDLKLDWIDGSYWSLFVEIRFYFIAAILYFINQSRFLPNILVFSLIVFVVHGALELAHSVGIAHTIVHGLLIPTHLPWFLFGIAAHCLWMGRERWAIALVSVGFLPLVAAAVAFGAWADLSIGLVVCSLFLMCLRFAAVRVFLSWRWLTSIGVSSYSLYLLHQNIGVTATSLLARHWSLSPDLALGLPLLVAAGLILVAHLIYRYWETPFNTLIVGKYRKSVILGAVSSQHRLSESLTPHETSLPDGRI